MRGRSPLLGLIDRLADRARRLSAERPSVGLHAGPDGVHATEFAGGEMARRTFSWEEAARATRHFYHVVSGVGGAGTLYKNVVLPQGLRARGVAEAVRWQFHEVDPSEYRIVHRTSDFYPEGNVNLVCAAVPVAALEEEAERFRGICTALDLRPFALWRGYRFLRPGEEPVVVVARDRDGILVVGGRAKLEFVREIPLGGNPEFERTRTVDFFRRAFDAAEAEVAEIGAEELPAVLSAGYALAPRDPEFVNLMPERFRRVRPTEFRRPRGRAAVAAACVALLLAGAAPHLASSWTASQAARYRELAARNAAAVSEGRRLAEEARRYREWTDAVATHAVTPYSEIVNDIRLAAPRDLALDRLEIAAASDAAPQPKPSATPGQGDRQAQAGSGKKEAAGGGSQAQLQASSRTAPEQAGAAAAQAQKQLPLDKGGAAQGQAQGQGQAREQGGQGQGKAPPAAPHGNRASYVPDTVMLVGKSVDLGSIGRFADNLLQLPYAEEVVVEEVEYDSGIGLYQFKISVRLRNAR